MTKKYDEKDYTPDDAHKIKELEQKEKIAEEIAEEYKQKQKSAKKKYIGIAIAAVIVAIFFGASSFFTVNLIGEEYKITPDTSLRSQFLIQNLKGDTIDTWISWKFSEGDLFHIHVVDSPYATEERLDAIIDVVMSSVPIEIDDSLLYKRPSGDSSTYYYGWMGALNSIGDTTFPVPKKLHFHVADKGEGDILIKLTNLSSAEGYSGMTLAVVDYLAHQILKSTITIYDIESQSTESLKTIVRHELGHGFGLVHSTATEDLMAPVITTNYPYISECDLDAITFLYNDGKSSQVTCEK